MKYLVILSITRSLALWCLSITSVTPEGPLSRGVLFVPIFYSQAMWHSSLLPSLLFRLYRLRFPSLLRSLNPGSLTTSFCPYKTSFSDLTILFLKLYVRLSLFVGRTYSCYVNILVKGSPFVRPTPFPDLRRSFRVTNISGPGCLGCTKTRRSFSVSPYGQSLSRRGNPGQNVKPQDPFLRNGGTDLGCRDCAIFLGLTHHHRWNPRGVVGTTLRPTSQNVSSG